MRRWWRYIIYTITIISCKKESTVTSKLWYDNIGIRTDIPFLPDAGANYFSYSFKRNTGDKVGLRFKSKFMYARYQSYNVYDINSRSSLVSLADIDTKADSGSYNPYITLTQSNYRNYTVNLLPDIPESQNFENKLLYPDSITNISILLRNYLAEQDVYGGVSLPAIEAFDIVSGKGIELPPTLALDFSTFSNLIDKYSKLIDLTQLLQKENQINCFRFAGLGLFQNLDNQYLLAPVRLYPNEVAIIKFLPPKSPLKFSELPFADVRYYSLCLGDSKTYTYKTTSDFQFKVASDGYIYIVIGRNQPDIIAKAAGLNFLEWVPELKNEGLIIYRNMLTHPAFPYNMNQIPDVLQNLNKIFDNNFLRADTYIGEHAPKGIKMTKAAYLSNFGGFQVAY